MIGAIDVHLVDPTWPPLVVAAGVGLGSALLGAFVGGRFVSRASREERAAAARRQEAALDVQRRADVAQYQRELLAKGTDRLLDALWTRERELCSALDLARNAARDKTPVTHTEPSIVALAGIELAIKKDLLTAAPFVADKALRDRILTAYRVANDCYNIRGGSMPGIPQGGSYEHFSRAMLEVQRYFAWLRWNLDCALQGERLPPPVDMPEVRRPLEANWGELAWPSIAPGWA